jgi:hypothetical protein
MTYIPFWLAAHESGHAVAAYLFGPPGTLGNAKIGAEGWSHVEQKLKEEKGECYATRIAVILFCGPLFEARLTGSDLVQTCMKYDDGGEYGPKGEYGDANQVVRLLKFPATEQYIHWQQLTNCVQGLLSDALLEQTRKIAKQLRKNGGRRYSSVAINALVRKFLEPIGLKAGEYCRCLPP